MHARLLALLTLLYFVDVVMVMTAVEKLLSEGPSFQLLLACEVCPLPAFFAHLPIYRCFSVGLLMPASMIVLP